MTSSILVWNTKCSRKSLERSSVVSPKGAIFSRPFSDGWNVKFNSYRQSMLYNFEQPLSLFSVRASDWIYERTIYLLPLFSQCPGSTTYLLSVLPSIFWTWRFLLNKTVHDVSSWKDFWPVVSSISPVIFYSEWNADCESDLWLRCHEANHWLLYQLSDMYWLSISHLPSQLQCYVFIFWHRRCYFFSSTKDRHVTNGKNHSILASVQNAPPLLHVCPLLWQTAFSSSSPDDSPILASLFLPPWLPFLLTLHFPARYYQ